jgi:hypothetical protein
LLSFACQRWPIQEKEGDGAMVTAAVADIAIQYPDHWSALGFRLLPSAMASIGSFDVAATRSDRLSWRGPSKGPATRCFVRVRSLLHAFDGNLIDLCWNACSLPISL